MMTDMDAIYARAGARAARKEPWGPMAVQYVGTVAEWRQELEQAQDGRVVYRYGYAYIVCPGGEGLEYCIAFTRETVARQHAGRISPLFMEYVSALDKAGPDEREHILARAREDAQLSDEEAAALEDYLGR